MIACKNCGFSEKPTSANLNIHLHSQNLVTDSWQQLADIESEITNVEALLRNLAQTRVHLKRDINARSTPIFRLPPEISSKIFVAYLLNNVWSESGWRSRFVSPLIFGGVCSSWRDLAWSMPRLWCSLRLDLTKGIDPALVEQWLVRSGAMLLSIHASIYDNILDHRVMAVRALDVVAKSSERWSHIAFQLPFFCYESFKCIENHLPNLESISLSKERWGDGEDEVELEMFSIAPQLRAVCMQGYYLQTLVLPTRQLTKLCVKSGCLDESIDMLRISPHVIDCEFQGIQFIDQGIHPPHAHTTRLESLEFHIDGHNNVTAAVFDSLTVSAAHDLTCHGNDFRFPYTNFISLVSRSHCSLQTLSLHSFRISDRRLIDCLRAVPYLHELSLSNLNITNETFWRLDPSNPDISDSILPVLKSFQYDGDLVLDFHILTSLLHHWSERIESTLINGDPCSVARVESVKICSVVAGVPSPQLLASLQCLVQKGMKISIITPEGTWP
jgi:hypothetical protein